MRTVIFLHILSGEMMLITIPFTKLGHMIFFFLYRFFIGSEYSFLPGDQDLVIPPNINEMEQRMSEPEMKADPYEKRLRGCSNQKKGKMKRLLSHCVHCSLCAESCFLFMAHDKDPAIYAFL